MITAHATAFSGQKFGEATYSFNITTTVAAATLAVSVSIVDSGAVTTNVMEVTLDVPWTNGGGIVDWNDTCLSAIFLFYDVAPGTFGINVTLDAAYDFSFAEAIELDKAGTAYGLTSSLGSGPTNASLDVDTTGHDNAWALYSIATEQVAAVANQPSIVASSSPGLGYGAFAAIEDVNPAAIVTASWDVVDTGPKWVVTGLALVASGEDFGDFFGDRYYSSAYFGPHYWGGRKHSLTPPTPPSTTVIDGPHGPGFNLFYPPKRHTPNPRDEIEELLRRHLSKAEDAETKVERREAAKELKAVVAEIVARDYTAELANVIEGLKALQSAKATLAEYVALVAQQVAEWEAEQDDLLAIQIMMELA